MKKRVIQVVMVACLMVLMVTAAGAAEVTHPVEGGNIYFDTATGTVTDCDTSVTKAVIPAEIEGVAVTAIGERAFYGNWHLERVTIPEGVTTIGAYAFASCSYLDSITIPDSVTTIGAGAFRECKNKLTSIELPGGLNSIADYLFYDCDTLRNITIPEGVTSIGQRAFYGCGLRSLTIPDSVATIGEGAFQGSSSLTSIVIPASVSSFGSYAFANCYSLTSVTIADGVTDIADYMFSQSSLTDIVFPASVSSIGKMAFYQTKLQHVTIPGTLTSVGSSVFSNCSLLTSAELLDGVTAISDNMFYNCPALSSVTLPDSLISIGNGAFSGCFSLANIELPGSVRSIGRSAFGWCKALSSITIPDSVTSIGISAFSRGCSLIRIEVADGNQSYKDINGVLFTKDGTELVQYPAGKETVDYTVPGGVLSIQEDAFLECTRLVAVTLPDGLSSIGDFAFSRCTSLTWIKIPDSVTSIGKQAFSSGLADIYYGGTEVQWSHLTPSVYNLENATIHYTPIWDFTKDSYSFSNSSEYFGSNLFGLLNEKIYVDQSHLNAWLDNLSLTDQANVAIAYTKNKFRDDLSETQKLSVIEDSYQKLRDNKLITWGGSCFGISLTTGLFRTGVLSPSMFENAQTTRDIPALDPDENSALESFINIYHMSQDTNYAKTHVTTSRSGDANFSARMRKIWHMAATIDHTGSDGLFILSMKSYSDEGVYLGGHAVLCYGAETGSWIVDGDRTANKRLLLADPNSIDEAAYVYFFESASTIVDAKYVGAYTGSGGFNPNAFGYRDLTFDNQLLDTLGIPATLRSNISADQSSAMSRTAQTDPYVVLDVYGEHNYTISTARGSAQIENGVLKSDTLGLTVYHNQEAISDLAAEPSIGCYLLLPAGNDYTITCAPDQSINLTANYGGLLYGVYGQANTIQIPTSGEVTVDGHGTVTVDVVNDHSDFDFLSISGELDGSATIRSDTQQVIVDGDWQDCTASHMNRACESTSISLADTPQFALSLDTSSTLNAHADTDGDGTYETKLEDRNYDIILNVTGDNIDVDITTPVKIIPTTLTLARYENGRMTGIVTKTLTAADFTEGRWNGSLYVDGSGDTYRAFLTDFSSLAPLCGAVST